ncbi:MAG: hypothetical protein QOJ26_1077 [Thermoplasmata archaeon]|jgi:hypothetical protein|nr:hypothetical protein [Thermoplasmata archaeon]MEA3166208.1 hypothetical protein [Thermoplasmata archaeon]
MSSSNNAVLTFNGVMEYQLWATAAGAKADILHVTERGGQLVVTYRAERDAAPAARSA